MMIKNEHGRTMIEMIGVLAIIGLLTLGGLSWYGNAISKMQANDLLTEVRKRALGAVSEEKPGLRNRFTEGMFNKQENGHAGLKGVSSYGYGVGDNTSGAKKLGNVTYVPVGALNHGNALTKGVCEALFNAVFDNPGESPKIGDVTGIYTYDGEQCTKTKLVGCESESEESDIPKIICVGIKS